MTKNPSGRDVKSLDTGDHPRGRCSPPLVTSSRDIPSGRRNPGSRPGRPRTSPIAHPTIAGAVIALRTRTRCAKRDEVHPQTLRHRPAQGLGRHADRRSKVILERRVPARSGRSQHHQLREVSTEGLPDPTTRLRWLPIRRNPQATFRRLLTLIDGQGSSAWRSSCNTPTRERNRCPAQGSQHIGAHRVGHGAIGVPQRPACDTMCAVAPPRPTSVDR